MASNHKIKNQSGDTLTVVMDTDREAHEIPPAGQAVFVKANPFDQPTFHVFRDWNRNNAPNKDQYLTSEKVNFWEAISATSTYVFNGSKLVHE